MGQILLIAFCTYLLYNFIFRFLIPVVRATRQVKKQMREFQQQAGNIQGGFNARGFSAEDFRQATGYGQTNPGYGKANSGYGNTNSGYQQHVNQEQQSAYQQKTEATKPQQSKPAKDDYIDFEEIK